MVPFGFTDVSSPQLRQTKYTIASPQKFVPPILGSKQSSVLKKRAFGECLHPWTCVGTVRKEEVRMWLGETQEWISDRKTALKLRIMWHPRYMRERPSAGTRCGNIQVQRVSKKKKPAHRSGNRYSPESKRVTAASRSSRFLCE
jgi:hypothetical protein